jgi:tail protein|nr:MAG TPA: tail tape measure [Caudoviricetes sp.]
MSVRTIGVKIDGLNDIETASKILLNMKKTVLDIEKLINKMGKSNSLPFVNIKLRLNTDEIEKQIKSINGLADKAKGQGKSPLDDKALRRTSIEVHNVAEAYKNLYNSISAVDGVVTKLTSNMIRLGAVNPAKTMLGSFKAISSEVLGIQRSLASMVGGGLKGSLTGIVSGIRTAFHTGLGELNKEANNLGDAMQIYRINMQALGKTEKEINLSMKRLGDYGKSSVFDATDLLEQASTFSAYNRSDAEEITKAFAGLTAQTKNPVEGMKTITTQMSQMLAAGVLNQGDFRFIREKFSALGASELNRRLTELAKSKGEDTIVDATRKRLISTDEFLDVVKQVGGDPRFQELVTSIITPRQAIANLKETLSNLLVFDKVDEEGNITPGALNKVYVATREFIKGITEIVGSAKFEEYIRKFGDAIGDLITKFSQVGRVVGLTQGSALLRSMETFGKELSKGFNGKGFINNIRELSKSIEDFFSTTGSSIGKFLGEAGNEYIKFLRSMVDIGKEGINKGFLDGITEVIKMYRNLADLAVSSGAVKLLSESFSRFFKVVNDVITRGANADALKSTVSSLGDFVKQLFDSIQFIGTKTNLIPTALGVVKSILNFFTEVMEKTQKGLNPSSVNAGLKKIGEVIDNLLKGLAPIVAELGSGLINALTSSSGVAFFKAIGNFIKAVVEGIRNLFAQLGSGNVEIGMRKVLNIFTTIVNVLTSIANVIGANAKIFLIGAVITKLGGVVGKLVTFLGNTINSLNSIRGVSSGSLFTRGSQGVSQGGSQGGFGGFLPFGKGSSAPKYQLGNRWDLSKQLMSNSYASYQLAYAQTGSRWQGLKAGVQSTKGYAKMFSQQASGAMKSFGKGALMLGGMFSGMIFDGVNGLVQNSNMSPILKKGSTVLTSTASSALMGASMGSFFGPIGTAIGAGVGGLLGVASGLFTTAQEAEIKEQERELKRQIKKEEEQAKEEQLKAKVEAIKEEGRSYTELLRGFYKSIGSNGESNLANSISTVAGISNQTGMDAKNAKSSIGLASINPDFERLSTYNVDINGEVKTWKDWKEQLGVTDEELLASLQLFYGSMGQKMFEVKSSIDGTALEIQTFTPGEQNRQGLNTERFKNAVMSIWGGLDQTKEYLYKDLSIYSESLKSALDGGKFSSKKDQETALIEALKQVGISEEFLKEQSRGNLIDYATKLQKSAENLSKSSQEANADRVESINKHLSKVPTEIRNILTDYVKNSSLDIAEEIDQVAYQYKSIKNTNDSAHRAGISDKLGLLEDKINEVASGKMNHILEGIRNSSKSDDTKKEKLSFFISKMKGFDEEIGDIIADRMVTKGETFAEAVKNFQKENTISPEKLEKTKATITNYTNAIGKMFDNGDIKIEEASALLYGIDISNIDTSKLDAKGKALLEEVKKKVDTTDGAIGKIKSAVGKNNPGDVDTSGIENASAEINQALNSLSTSVAGAMGSILTKIRSGSGSLASRIGSKKSKHKFSGGKVKYFSGGSIGGVDYVSRGTDTVPTMLTPGEYVLRKKAVDSLGTNFLDKLNKYGFSALQKGTGQTIINNVYNNNNAQISQNIDNKSQYLNGMYGIDKLMRYV